ncbi:1,6-anhydro-N-acetylmuramyl-L-alanine amidase AmpD [uncultured Oceanicoccus sp.]|uniref:1,6-anhydro-N-acetylmuramyl-L-alanine amidase AmpD n=1 Tax=uncultured Oceanicoccus sp. TaxID=1706381 RepID=UPI0030DAE3EC
MNLDSDHWLADSRHLPTDNFNARPAGVEISLLVIHNISLPAGEFGGDFIEQLFTNCLDCDAHADFNDLRDLTVSSHCLINRAGEITQFVPFNQRAWHAGDSSFQGRSNCNDFSIGIELEGTDNCPYTALQYQALQQLTRQIMTDYPAITIDRIVGHCDIAPGRKTDPGSAFDWSFFKGLLA